MTKVKGKDLAKLKHPNSRKTNALLKGIQKQVHRIKCKSQGGTKTRENKKHVGNLKLNILGEKVLWVRDNLELHCSHYSPQQTITIIEKYLSRFDNELEQIKLKHSIGNRKNRQHASREDIINMTIKNETQEFISCGLEIPDLLNPQQFNLLKKWNGELRFLQNFKMKRFSRKYLDDESKKPEKYKAPSSSSNKQTKTENVHVVDEMDIN